MRGKVMSHTQDNHALSFLVSSSIVMMPVESVSVQPSLCLEDDHTIGREFDWALRISPTILEYAKFSGVGVSGR
jgi:hypothetical protein